jgi:membrane-associated HD superfamily phosphohydrolase
LEGHNKEGSSKEKKKKNRRSSKEVQRENAATVQAKKQNSEAMTAATVMIQKNQQLNKNDPNHNSVKSIVDQVNNRYNSTINDKTAGWYVKNGLIGTLPLKRVLLLRISHECLFYIFKAQADGGEEAVWNKEDEPIDKCNHQFPRVHKDARRFDPEYST